jgi:hypothetical protein
MRANPSNRPTIADPGLEWLERLATTVTLGVYVGLGVPGALRVLLQRM